MKHDGETLRREIARVFLRKLNGDDKAFLGMTEHNFCYVDGRRIIPVRFMDVEASTRGEAEDIVAREHAAT